MLTGFIKVSQITLDIEVGDMLLGGRFQNKRIEVKELGTNEIGQPTVNGRSLLRYRIEKQLPKDMRKKSGLYKIAIEGNAPYFAGEISRKKVFDSRSTKNDIETSDNRAQDAEQDKYVESYWKNKL